MKTCKTCNVSKPFSEYTIQDRGKPSARYMPNCKPCRAKTNSAYNHRKRAEKDLIIHEETPAPCDFCFGAKTCEKECASYRTWQEHGV